MAKNKPKALLTLPSKEVMLERLKRANDSLDYINFLYPTLLKFAETEVSEEGMFEMFEEAIKEYQLHVRTFRSNFIWFKTKPLIRALAQDPEVRILN